MNIPKPSILLIDDDIESIERLRDRLGQLLGDSVELIVWRPTPDDGNTREAFDRQITDRTALVVTDYDLTTSLHGLFGLSIVGWCQGLAIPVGDFSRANFDALPKEPNLFELRVPTSEEQAAAFIANAFTGFQFIKSQIDERPEILTAPRSLATALSIFARQSELRKHVCSLYVKTDRLQFRSSANDKGFCRRQHFTDRRAKGAYPRLCTWPYIG